MTFYKSQQIDDLCNEIDHKTEIITMCHSISDREEIFSPNKVKVVFNNKQQALYFSRAPIPYQKNQNKSDWIIEKIILVI